MFAGCTVVISLLSLMLVGVRFVQSLAMCSAIVAITVLASVTLLPALLGLAGERIERTRWRGLVGAGFAAVALMGLGLKNTTVAVAAAAIVLAIVEHQLGLLGWSEGVVGRADEVDHSCASNLEAGGFEQLEHRR